MCIIGPVETEELKGGSDGPMRVGVKEAFEKELGREEEKCWSGWGVSEEELKEYLALWSRVE